MLENPRNLVTLRLFSSNNERKKSNRKKKKFSETILCCGQLLLLLCYPILVIVVKVTSLLSCIQPQKTADPGGSSQSIHSVSCVGWVWTVEKVWCVVQALVSWTCQECTTLIEAFLVVEVIRDGHLQDYILDLCIIGLCQVCLHGSHWGLSIYVGVMIESGHWDEELGYQQFGVFLQHENADQCRPEWPWCHCLGWPGALWGWSCWGSRPR